MLSSWRRVVAGEVKPETRAAWPAAMDAAIVLPRWVDLPPGERRCSIAIRMARQQGGRITTTQLAEVTGTSDETARTDLGVLCLRGELLAVGARRGRYYQCAPGWDAGRNGDGVAVAAE